MGEGIMVTLLLSLVSYFFSVAAISPGSTLYASNTNHSWSSPKNRFSLNFIPFPTSPPSFKACIVYSGGVPVIWTAGNGTPVDSGGSFQFLLNGSLRLVNGSGATVWDSRTSNLGVSSASLEDDGNLVLFNGTGTVWSSFECPTDTIVPSQNFTTSMVLQSGLYSFRLLSMGNLMLRWNNSVPYWNQGVNASINGSLTRPVLGLQPMGILSIHDPNLTSSAIVAYSSDYAEGTDVLRILKLDTNGNLRIYSSSRGSGTATARWAAVEDQCEVFGYCGIFGICSYKDSIPICKCPSQNFELNDANDTKKGCRRKVKLEDCPDRISMLQLNHARLLTYPPIFFLNLEVMYIPISACKGNCLSVGSCFASTSLSDGSGFCYLKTSDFFSGYQNPALPSTSYIKVCLPVAPNPPPSLQEAGKGKDWRVHAWMIVVLVLGTLLAFLVFEGGLWCCCFRNSLGFGGFSAKYAILEYASGATVQFSYEELQGLTKGFKEKLGVRGMGSVYRGTLANGTDVAVKQLEGIENEDKQFRLELAKISSTHHLNLVRLIGFCSEGRHRFLVNEFMKNGSLDNFLFVTELEQPEKLLDWECRFNIALGTAKGITYLHEECQQCIVHCDIKPENILLDEKFNVNLSDFCLAKLISPEGYRCRGYIAPECLTNLPITSKSDVYSYGMVLLEIVSGRRNFEVSEETNSKMFSFWAYEEFENGNIKGVIDKRLVDIEFHMEQVKRAINTSFWCIQENPSQRPTMGKVVQMLEGITETERPPAPKLMTGR